MQGPSDTEHAPAAAGQGQVDEAAQPQSSLQFLQQKQQMQQQRRFLAQQPGQTAPAAFANFGRAPAQASAGPQALFGKPANQAAAGHSSGLALPFSNKPPPQQQKFNLFSNRGGQGGQANSGLVPAQAPQPATEPRKATANHAFTFNASLAQSNGIPVRQVSTGSVAKAYVEEPEPADDIDFTPSGHQEQQMNMMGADFAENVEYVDSPEPAMIEPKAITPPLSETSTEAEFRAHQGPQAPIRLAPQPKVGAVARQVPQAQQPPRGTKPDSQANFMAPAAPGSFLKPRRQHPVAAAMSPSQHPVSPKDDQAAGFKSPAVPAPVVPQRQQSQPVAPRVVQPKQHANLMANATQPTQALVRTPPVKRAREESMDFDASEFGTPATKDSPRNDNSAPIVPKSVKRQKPAARSPVVDFETEVVAQLSQPLDFSAIIQLEEEVRQMTVENAEQCDENDKQMQGLKQDAREVIQYYNHIITETDGYFKELTTIDETCTYFLAQTQAATEAAQALICALLVLGDDVKSAKPLNTAGAGAELAKEQAAELEVIEIAEEAQEIPLPPEILSNELPEVDLPSDEEGFLQLVPEGAGRQQNKEDESSETGPAKATEGTSEDDHAPINGNLMQGVEPDDVDELEMVKETQLFADDATIGQEN